MHSNFNSRALSALMLAVLVSGSVFYLVGCGGGGGGGSIGIGGTVIVPQQANYDIQIVGPPATGAQVNRPMSMTVNFMTPGTANPINVQSIESLSVTKASGPGNLSGTVSMAGTNTPSLVFSNLIIDTQGTYTLQVSGPRATAPVVSASFTVGPQMDLAFTTIPSATVYRPRTFSVTVSTVDPSTSAPVVSPFPIAITVVRNPSAGAGTVGGTTTQTLTGASALVMSGLTYSTDETVSLQASAFGFSTVNSGGITFDSLVLANPTVTANPMANSNFTVGATVRSATSGLAVSISPAIACTLSVATGTGTLSGTTAANSGGSNVSIAGARYNQPGPATFTISSTEAASVTTGAVTFLYALSVTAQGPVAAQINQTIGPFQFAVRDGQGALYTGAISNLSWQIVNRTTSAQIQSSTAVFTGGLATVSPAVIGTAGPYRLEGTVTSPTTTPTTVTIDIDITNLTQVDAPGPFLALKSVRVGSAYSDSVTFAQLAGTTTGTAGTYGVLTGSMPAGLTINSSTGVISGTPTTAGAYSFTIFAMQTGGTTIQPLRCALAVFSASETEIPAVAPDFRVAGSYAVQTFTILPTATGTPVNTNYLDITYPCTSTFDNGTRATSARIWAPVLSSLTAPAPVLIHHHGVGQHFREYNNLGNHLASYGIITISIEDVFSFYAPSTTPATSTWRSPFSAYGGGSPTYIAGMQSAGGFQEGTMALMLALNQAATGAISGTMLSGYTSTATLTGPSSTPFVGKVDPLKVFMSGHSRGAGATQQSHSRYLQSKCRGVIFFSVYDLRHRAETDTGAGPYAANDVGYTPTTWNYWIQAVPTATPRLPCLSLAYEKDGDLVYPIADQIGDRSVGPVTNVTVFGANHNGTCDAHPTQDGVPYITPAEQQLRNWNLVTAFIKRWTDADGRSLDGVLYANEFVNASTDRSHNGIMGWRNMAERIMIDDFQDGNVTTNSLGGANSLSVSSRSEASIYPVYQNLANIGIRHNIISLPIGTTATYSTAFSAQDLTTRKRLAMRIGQTTIVGYDWVTVRVRLTDSANATSTLTVFDRANQTATYLPDFASTNPKYDRFVDLQVKLTNFTGINMTAVTKVELIFESDSTTGGTRQVYTDDIRFE